MLGDKEAHFSWRAGPLRQNRHAGHRSLLVPLENSPGQARAQGQQHINVETCSFCSLDVLGERPGPVGAH
eukprot:3655571-Pyramimonas_sp.AAC.1